MILVKKKVTRVGEITHNTLKCIELCSLFGSSVFYAKSTSIKFLATVKRSCLTGVQGQEGKHRQSAWDFRVWKQFLYY